MANNISTTTNNSVQYQKQLLETMFVAPVFEQFALVGKLTGTKNAAWNRVNRISPGTPAPMGLGITPSPTAQIADEITASADWYGALTKVARQAYVTDPNGQIAAMTKAIGQQGNELREVIQRNAIISGVGTTYYSNSANRVGIASPIRLIELNRISRALYLAGAGQITQIIKATSGVSTTPIGASYVCVINGNVENDVRALSGFISVEKYPNSSPSFIGEIGSVTGYRFVKSNIMLDMYYANAGGAYASTYLSDNSTNCNIYPCLIFGEQAFGILDLESFQMISKGLEQAGSALNMYSTMGYLFATVSKVLNPLWCAVLEVAATA
jgi:N4-gp56 family major capsid protein